MNNASFEHLTIGMYESAVLASWKYHLNNRILIVLDELKKFYGIITSHEIKSANKKELLVKDICNCDCKKIIHNNNNQDSDYREYEQAALIFANNSNINVIPIITSDGYFYGFLYKEQVFWKSLFDENKLPRMHYAYCMYNAALEAKKLGYNSISVIEFGVAGGNGLVSIEFHAKEIERLLGIKLELYGFDSGIGLPPPSNISRNEIYKDLPHIFQDFDYKMDVDLLKSRLTKAKLVLGNIQETRHKFWNEFSPSPIAVMLIDVDRYSSTVPVLDMLKSECTNFLPRVYMYFDDLYADYEFQGELLAIKEFNSDNQFIKISPEGYRDMSEHVIKDTPYGLRATNFWGYRNIKTCHFFNHPKYKLNCKKSGTLSLRQSFI